MLFIVVKYEPRKKIAEQAYKFAFNLMSTFQRGFILRIFKLLPLVQDAI